MFRSIWAVAAGYLAISLLSGFTIVILAIYLPDQYSFSMLKGPSVLGGKLLLLILTAVYSLFGGMLTSTLAPKRPSWHVHVLAFLVLLMGSFSAASAIPMGQPVWYALALPLIGTVCVEAGRLLLNKLNQVDLDQLT